MFSLTIQQGSGRVAAGRSGHELKGVAHESQRRPQISHQTQLQGIRRHDFPLATLRNVQPRTNTNSSTLSPGSRKPPTPLRSSRLSTNDLLPSVQKVLQENQDGSFSVPSISELIKDIPWVLYFKNHPEEIEFYRRKAQKKDGQAMQVLQEVTKEVNLVKLSLQKQEQVRITEERKEKDIRNLLSSLEGICVAFNQDGSHTNEAATSPTFKKVNVESKKKDNMSVHRKGSILANIENINPGTNSLELKPGAVKYTQRIGASNDQPF